MYLLNQVVCVSFETKKSRRTGMKQKKNRRDVAIQRNHWMRSMKQLLVPI